MSGFTEGQWTNLLILGAFHTCLTYILMYSVFKKLLALLIAVLSYIYPVVTILAHVPEKVHDFSDRTVR